MKPITKISHMELKGLNNFVCIMKQDPMDGWTFSIVIASLRGISSHQSQILSETKAVPVISPRL